LLKKKDSEEDENTSSSKKNNAKIVRENDKDMEKPQISAASQNERTAEKERTFKKVTYKTPKNRDADKVEAEEYSNKGTQTEEETFSKNSTKDFSCVNPVTDSLDNCDSVFDSNDDNQSCNTAQDYFFSRCLGKCVKSCISLGNLPVALKNSNNAINSNTDIDNKNRSSRENVYLNNVEKYIKTEKSKFQPTLAKPVYTMGGEISSAANFSRENFLARRKRDTKPLNEVPSIVKRTEISGYSSPFLVDNITEVKPKYYS